MKKVAVLLATLVVVVSSVPAQATAIVGSKCVKANATKAVGRLHFKCVRRGGKLVWRAETSPSHTPVRTPSPSPTPTPVGQSTATPVVTDTPTTRVRQTTDQPDLLSGFQIKPFYVVPSDGTDRHLDTDGTLDMALTEGDNFLQQQIGYHLQIDKRADGYDITYLHSQYTAAELSAAAGDKLLMNEAHVMDNPGPNRKHFLFFIEVPYLTDGGSNACGFGDTPGLTAEVAVAPGQAADGTTCTGSDLAFKSVTSAFWVHEVLHTFGVTHTLDDPCDLMYPQLGTCSSAYAIDAGHTRYVGAAAQGVNVLSLRVWADHVADPSLRADCELPSSQFPRADGHDYAYCGTGTQQIGEYAHCWSPQPAAQLQALVDGTWTAVGSARWSNQPWGASVRLDCGGTGYLAASTMVTVTAPGIVSYRWLINGRVDETFTVIWVA